MPWCQPGIQFCLFTLTRYSGPSGRGCLTYRFCGRGSDFIRPLKVPASKRQRRLGKNFDKIKRITVHYYETSKESTFPSSVSVGEDSDESDSDNDLVLCDESERESESDDDSHTVTIQEGSSTRSGRRVGHWSSRYADFFQ